MTTTETREQRAASAYQAGATLRQVAAEYSVNESTVRAWLARLGVDTRRSGPPELPVTDDEIVQLVEAGESWTIIAEAVGMSRSGVRGRYRRIQGLDRWR